MSNIIVQGLGKNSKIITQGYGQEMLEVVQPYSVDVLLKVLDVVKDYDIDVLLKRLNDELAYSLDTVIGLLNIAKDYQIDYVAKLLNVSLPYSLDTIIKKLDTTVPYQLDAIFTYLNRTAPYNADVVIVKKNNMKNIFIDTVLSKESMSPYLIDILTKTLVTKGYDVDVSFTTKNITQGYSVDVILLALAQGQSGPTVQTLRPPKPRAFSPEPIEFIEAKVERVCSIKESICFEMYDRHVLSVTELLLFKKYEDVFSISEVLVFTRNESFMKIDSSLFVPHQTRLSLQSDIAFHNRTQLFVLQNSITQKRRESIIHFEETIKTPKAIKDQLKRLDDLDSVN